MAHKTTARGTFDVKLVSQAAPGAPVGRMTIDKRFSGDLEATSVGEMLTVMGEVKGSAAYAALERVTGILEGREGTFALLHRGTLTRGHDEMSVVVTPDSGTGALRGIHGAMRIHVAPDGAHSYELEYGFEE